MSIPGGMMEDKLRETIDKLRTECGHLQHENAKLREELELSERDRANVRASVAHACAQADKRVGAARAKLAALAKVTGLIVPALEQNGLPNLARQLREALKPFSEPEI